MYFEGEDLILDQQDFIERSVEKLISKGLFKKTSSLTTSSTREKEAQDTLPFPTVTTLKSEDFHHLHLYVHVII